jgi:hypothetical protein
MAAKLDRRGETEQSRFCEHANGRDRRSISLVQCVGAGGKRFPANCAGTLHQPGKRESPVSRPTGVSIRNRLAQ